MPIDWFTVSAQALNFLILVWLMKRFLYKPILGAIDAREQRIAMELAAAAASKADAEKEREAFARKNEQFEQERAELMRQAVDAATGERRRLLDEARNAAEVLGAKRQETLRSEFETLTQAVSRRAQQEVFAIARKALADLADSSLEERMGEVFIRRLRQLQGQDKQELAEAIRAGSGAALVRSAFDLPLGQQSGIRAAINQAFDADIQVRFETVPELIGGMELSTKGRKLAWSIDEYLASLQRSVGELLETPSGSEPARPPEALPPEVLPTPATRSR